VVALGGRVEKRENLLAEEGGKVGVGGRFPRKG
jgi:hypothetical protein